MLGKIGVCENRAVANLPAAPDLRDHLPGIEPERQVDDWGRSERVSNAFDRLVVEFFYHVWFRTEVEGLQHVPRNGPALLVSNHSGALPPDAAMIGKAIKEDQGRDVRPIVEHFFKGVPGLSMLVTKIGAVPAHPANAHRLLHDEQGLVLVFPEGRKGTEKLYKDRYRVQRFGRGGFVETAMRAGAPIVPIALVGAEEAMPVFAQLNPLARLTGLIYAPLSPLFYLPAKFFVRFLPPVRTDEMGPDAAEDKALVQTVAHDIRATIQEELFDMLGQRRSVWLG
jgi:1-acyl-sn-glycerol-3-phosphate acyltransferase